jgi:protein involved in polysaccharide export with SLBB domain
LWRPSSGKSDRAHRGDTGRLLRLLATTAALVIPFGLSVSGCTPARSYERSVDGSIIYLDQLSEAEKTAARDRIAQTLMRGFERYELNVGDEVEILFHVDRRPTRRDYVISVADKLRVEFLDDTDTNRVIEVRPDGRISMPLLGPVVAAGKTVDALAREVERRYSGLLENPQVTINLTEVHTPLEDFLSAVGPMGRARTVVDKVLPDGTMQFPLIGAIPARGLTLTQLQRAADSAYVRRGLDVTVSIIPRTLRAGTIMVFGEVGKPGRIETNRPMTVLMTIAEAGGILRSGSLEGVRVFYFGDDALPRVRLVNLREVIQDLRIEQDMIIPRNSVVYVPPTELAKLGRTLDAVLHPDRALTKSGRPGGVDDRPLAHQQAALLQNFRQLRRVEHLLVRVGSSSGFPLVRAQHRKQRPLLECRVAGRPEQAPTRTAPTAHAAVSEVLGRQGCTEQIIGALGGGFAGDLAAAGQLADGPPGRVIGAVPAAMRCRSRRARCGSRSGHGRPRAWNRLTSACSVPWLPFSASTSSPP